MNWIKQNTFLAGFIAAMVIGVGALGFLLFSASSRYDEVRNEYEAKVNELNRLETLKPYPEEANLKQFDEQKKEHAAKIQEFIKKVTAVQVPLEPISPVQFQDKLREAVTRVTAKVPAGVTVPTGFYLGFEKYQTQPPTPEAAPALGRQLKALEFVATKMLEIGVTQLAKFDRSPLPEEDGKPKKPEEPPARGSRGAGAEKPSKTVMYHPVRIEFTTDQSRFGAILNEVVSAKEQFFVPRLVSVKNDGAEVIPQRVAAAAVVDPTAKTEIKYIFGSEKVLVTLDLEVVDFAEVAAK